MKAVALLVPIAAVAGYAVGVARAPERAAVAAAPSAEAEPAPRPLNETHPSAPVIPPRPAPAASCEQDRQELGKTIAELQTKVAVMSWFQEGARIDKEGEPVPWPADTPDALTPARYEANVHEINKECGAHHRVVRFECSEPPCIAALAATTLTDGYLAACPSWKQRYGATTSLSMSTVECPHGKQVQVQLLSPYAEVFAGDEEAKRNYRKRLSVRWKAILSNWPCDDAGR